MYVGPRGGSEESRPAPPFRRWRRRAGLLGGAILALRMAAAPLPIGDRLELMVDHYLIERMDGVRLELAHPQRAEIVLSFDQPWERAVNYATVLQDGSVYRLYYRGVMAGPGGDLGPAGEVTCYAESADGVHWRKPVLGLVAYQDRHDTNIILGPDPEHRTTHNFAPFIDDRPGVPAAERYKAVGGLFHDNSALVPDREKMRTSGGLWRFVSADGIHWRRVGDTALFAGYALDTLNSPSWLPAEQCYAIYLRTWSEGGTPDRPEFRGFRTISRSISKDFVHWTKPEPMTFGDAPMEHLYTNGTHPYFRAPHLLIALPFRFWPDRQAYPAEQQIAWGVHPTQAHGVADAVFMTSRGGTRYDRTFMESFIRPGRDPLAWHARDNSPARGVVPTGDGEMSFYAVTHYTLPDCYLRRYTLRTDGFASAHAGYAPGTLLTKVFTYGGNALALNFSTSAAGEMSVELLDDRGNVLATVEPMIGDDIERRVAWRGRADVREFAGRPVRLRFTLKDADLYSLRFMR